MFFKKLYLRIWLAVILAVAVLTLLLGWAWRLAAEPPLREAVIRNEAGQVIGQGARVRRPPNQQAPNRPEAEPEPELEPKLAPAPPNMPPPHHMQGKGKGNWVGPEFEVRMNDGRTVFMHLPRPAASFWSRPPFGFFWMLGLVGIAVALATYPIIRKLTRRLELLQNSVQKWGEGDLSTRVSEHGQDEVAFLARGFNQAAERVENLVKSHETLLASQKSLLANASHELRSPLTRLRMGLELLGPTATPATRQDMALDIAELDELIEEILLASRLDAREADVGTLESVDLLGLVAEECARANAELEVQWPHADASTGANANANANANTSAEAMTSLPVHGVAKLLRRAVRNLLENSKRHGAGQMTVELVKTNAHAQIRVCDRGPGVPPELLERIFEPFYRLPGASERDGGVGLGLALVKSIALRHGGRVHCENRPEGGACFVIDLPLENAPASAKTT
jgi:signal transduction histidine kinase